MKSLPEIVHHELEAKYAINESRAALVDGILNQMSDNGLIMIAGQRDIDLVDYYFDTPDYVLARHHSSIRLRDREGRRTKLTFKQESEPAGNVLHDRIELEGSPSSSLIASILEHSPWLAIRQRRGKKFITSGNFELLHAIGVFNVFRINNTRSIYTVVSSDSLYAEISIDHAHFIKDQLSVPTYEFEIEYLSGDKSLLPALCRNVEHYMPWLKPSKSSKYHRGLKQLKLWRPEKKKRKSQLKTWRKQLSNHLRRFDKLLKKALTFNNPRDLHKSRVTLRQIITLLQYFPIKETDEHSSSRQVQRRLKAIQKILGRIRDLDVFIEQHESGSLPGVFDDRSTAAMTTLINLRRYEYRLDALRLLDELYDRQFVKLWQRMLELDLPELIDKVKVERDYMALKARFELSLEEFENARNEQGPMHPMTIKRLHRSRILLKQLRYSSEHLSSIAPGSASDDSENYAMIQDHLGGINDLSNLRDLYSTYEHDLGAILNDKLTKQKLAIEQALSNKLISLDIDELREPGTDIIIDPGVELQDIKGVGPKTESALIDAGITNVFELAQLNLEQLETSLDIDPSIASRAGRERWIEQAREILK